MKVTAIVVAAGVGRRMGAAVNKVLLPLGGRPVLAHSLEALNASARIDRIVVVTRSEDMDAVKSLVCERGITKAAGQIVLGGAERFDSVLGGLNWIAHDPPWAVLIHDAARPFLTHRMIEESLAALDRWVGAIIGVPSKDTVKQVGDHQKIVATLDRSRLWITQTPQTFRYEPILEAYRDYQPPPYPTDDASLLEQKGASLVMIEGSLENIKITNSEDLLLAEALLRLKDQ